MPLSKKLPVKTFKLTFKSPLTIFIADLNFFSKTFYKILKHLTFKSFSCITNRI
ncbi:hypothetical protein GGTG_12388 [Gaeumannomyces tritici R3-111a-1]|uniref:Uncharacterized protein n=1 Tax=Gaeumannomyces tritici (strain R3-111a-1) TaxID=644352 RepID=J3PFW3_GAET3|nr:hypothetical protein GGTG_12388 [Gaeumannomyces tritici R3-111a-1]EJT70215.1 hypothetical protein GGTG_12388 [Gaeumannomyces tritici R3-111a-1]